MENGLRNETSVEGVSMQRKQERKPKGPPDPKPCGGDHRNDRSQKEIVARGGVIAGHPSDRAEKRVRVLEGRRTFSCPKNTAPSIGLAGHGNRPCIGSSTPSTTTSKDAGKWSAS